MKILNFVVTVHVEDTLYGDLLNPQNEYSTHDLLCDAINEESSVPVLQISDPLLVISVNK